MKLLFFTDTHIKATNPISRTDDYLSTLKYKFNEVKEIIKEEKIDYVLHGGDLFDRPDVPVRIVGKFANILKSFNVPIYMISGNHDIFGHNPSTVERSMIGLLNTLNIVHLINKDEPIILKDSSINIQISGAPYIYDIDSNFKNYYFPKRLDNIDYHIFMIHSFLLDKPFINTVSHTLIDEIKDVDADIILSGHYHTGFGIKEYNNKYFVNPGSLLRTNSSIPEINRMPKVLIIELSKEKIFLRERFLQTALEGKLVLNQNDHSEKLRAEALEDFKLLVRENTNLENYNIIEILKEISTKNDFPKKILEEALKRLEDVEVNKK